MTGRSRSCSMEGFLADADGGLDDLLTYGDYGQSQFGVEEISVRTLHVRMRDGTRLATDLYLPPFPRAPTIVRRAPYGRASDKFVGAFMSFARRGYVVVSQDVRGTGDSEPDGWDYYMYEPDDSYDTVEWISSQSWFNGFIGACGGSYDGQTQWCMSRHPKMTAIAPEVSALGIAGNSVNNYMVLNAYAKSVGKGKGKVNTHYLRLEREMLPETLSGGYFNPPLLEPVPDRVLQIYPELLGMSPSRQKMWLWTTYCGMSCGERASFVKVARGVNNISVVDVDKLQSLFGHRRFHDAHTLPSEDRRQLFGSLHAPALMITGWYDWCLTDTLATWESIRREANDEVSSNSRLLIAPSAHNATGYHEGFERNPELQHNHRVQNHVGLLIRWYKAVQEDATHAWPRVIYYLMGANEWRCAPDWPPPQAEPVSLYLQGEGRLDSELWDRQPDETQFVYDPDHPTPTVGGSIVSNVYPPGSVDVSEVQSRSDVIVFTSGSLKRDLDVVGPLKLVLFASSSVRDTDFVARLTDVFPDGRAIQIQSGILRARFRGAEPELLEPGQIYELEIDMWATANRFKIGHSLRIDIASADFPRFDRNTNLGGAEGTPIAAVQTIYHDVSHPSRLVMFVLNGGGAALSSAIFSPQSH